MDWLGITMGLFGGLALFLFGLDQLARGLRSAAGEGMKLLLARLTRNRVSGALTGAVVTAVLNSSSVTTVLVVGFISAGLMSLAQSIGVIMGANIGSTVTAQIVAFHVTRYALGMIAVGFLLLFASRKGRVREYGSMIMGLGLVFFGMGVMGESMAPLRAYEPFMALMESMESPLLGILVGAVFTGLVQSSAATMGIAIVMASEGLVTLPAGIALALGANIGTCVTALLAALGKPREAQRAAAAHVLFNVLGVLLWVGFIDQLARLAVSLAPAHPELDGASRLAAEVPRQIAHANTLFNVVNTALFLPLTGLFARAVTRLLPDRRETREDLVRPRFLDDELLDSPALALERVRLEFGHLGSLVLGMWRRLARAFLARERAGFDEVARMDDDVDHLHREILAYLGRIRRRELSAAESRAFVRLLGAVNHLETIGDVLETSLVNHAHRMLDHDIRPSETMKLTLDKLGRSVLRSVELAVQAVAREDMEAAREALRLRKEINPQLEEVLRYQAERLSEDEKRVEIFHVEMGVVDSLKRAYTLSKRMAKLALRAGEEKAEPE